MIKGVGVDIIEVSRMEKILKGAASERFLSRVFTPLEIDYCRGKAKPAQHFAARFAAKEAVFKALGTGWARGLGWKDVEVRNDMHGAPLVFLHGRARELFREQGGGRVLISLSHTARSAIAQVLWVGNHPAATPPVKGEREAG